MTGGVPQEERRGRHLVADDGDAGWAGIDARVEDISTLHAPVRLVVRSVLTRVADARGLLYEPPADSLTADPPGAAGARSRPAPPR